MMFRAAEAVEVVGDQLAVLDEGVGVQSATRFLNSVGHVMTLTTQLNSDSVTRDIIDTKVVNATRNVLKAVQKKMLIGEIVVLAPKVGPKCTVARIDNTTVGLEVLNASGVHLGQLLTASPAVVSLTATIIDWGTPPQRTMSLDVAPYHVKEVSLKTEGTSTAAADEIEEENKTLHNDIVVTVPRLPESNTLTTKFIVWNASDEKWSDDVNTTLVGDTASGRPMKFDSAVIFAVILDLWKIGVQCTNVEVLTASGFDRAFRGASFARMDVWILMLLVLCAGTFVALALRRDKDIKSKPLPNLIAVPDGCRSRLWRSRR